MTETKPVEEPRTEMREPDEFVYEQLLPNERFESFRQNDSDVRQTEEV